MKFSRASARRLRRSGPCKRAMPKNIGRSSGSSGSRQSEQTTARVVILVLAIRRWAECRLWVKTSRQTMSAAATAFAESGHGSPIPRDRDGHCASKVEGRPPRATLEAGQHVFPGMTPVISIARRFRLTSGALRAMARGSPFALHPLESRST
jgi:hypothetical protein